MLPELERIVGVSVLLGLTCECVREYVNVRMCVIRVVMCLPVDKSLVVHYVLRHDT